MELELLVMGCHLIDIPFRTLGLKYLKVLNAVGSITKMWNQIII